MTPKFPKRPNSRSISYSFRPSLAQNLDEKKNRTALRHDDARDSVCGDGPAASDGAPASDAAPALASQSGAGESDGGAGRSGCAGESAGRAGSM